MSCVERSTGRATFEALLAPLGYALVYRNCDNLVYGLGGAD